MRQIKAYVRLEQVVLQYTHDEWSIVTSPGLLIIGLSYLTSRQEVVWLLYMIATNPYYFPVVIVPVSQNINRGQQQAHTASACSVNVDIRLGYLAANTSSTKDTLTRYLPRPEVH